MPPNSARIPRVSSPKCHRASADAGEPRAGAPSALQALMRVVRSNGGAGVRRMPEVLGKRQLCQKWAFDSPRPLLQSQDGASLSAEDNLEDNREPSEGP